jgi:hypothetical protein
VKFEGEFKKGYKNGLGTLFYVNGEKIKGRFIED